MKIPARNPGDVLLVDLHPPRMTPDDDNSNHRRSIDPDPRDCAGTEGQRPAGADAPGGGGGRPHPTPDPAGSACTGSASPPAAPTPTLRGGLENRRALTSRCDSSPTSAPKPCASRGSATTRSLHMPTLEHP